MPDGSTSPNDAFTEEAAFAALTGACQQVGISANGAELIRIGSNAVFRLGDVIARIAPSTALLANAEKQIAVARWLDSIDYPAMRALDVPQPVEAAGRVVTFWHSVAAETKFAPIADMATLIRQLHSITSVPPDLVLPEIQPFGPPDSQLPEFPGLPGADAQFLQERIIWARDAFPTLPYVLPYGVIHGDANVGNALLDDERRAVLVDLDSFAVGPREWDLIQTALFYDRLGWHTEAEYRTFVDVYGFDLMTWSGYKPLADMREVAMTSWLSRKSNTSDEAAREATKRIDALRSDGRRRDWSPY
ncbi:MAG: phosphotransferase family protein [Dehalococcoidia bacterium]